MQANRTVEAQSHQPRPVADIRVECIFDNERLKKQIKSAVRRRLPQISPMPANSGTAVLCGSGPSLRDSLDDIKGHLEKGDIVVAIKGAHDYLIERGIIPTAGLAIDPQPKIFHTFTPRNDVKYYFASQVHPSVFNKFNGYDVNVFHMYTNIPNEEMADIIGDGFLLGGGSTSGLRAMTLFFVLGYRNFHLYGYDSCMSDGIRKITGEGQQHKKLVNVHVGSPDSPEIYVADVAMAAQADEFEKMIKFLGEMAPIQITTHGHGLIPAIARYRASKGCTYCRHAD